MFLHPRTIIRAVKLRVPNTTLPHSEIKVGRRCCGLKGMGGDPSLCCPTYTLLQPAGVMIKSWGCAQVQSASAIYNTEPYGWDFFPSGAFMPVVLVRVRSDPACKAFTHWLEQALSDCQLAGFYYHWGQTPHEALMSFIADLQTNWEKQLRTLFYLWGNWG